MNYITKKVVWWFDINLYHFFLTLHLEFPSVWANYKKGNQSRRSICVSEKWNLETCVSYSWVPEKKLQVMAVATWEKINWRNIRTCSPSRKKCLSPSVFAPVFHISHRYHWHHPHNLWFPPVLASILAQIKAGGQRPEFYSPTKKRTLHFNLKFKNTGIMLFHK